jgi:hypothetical protein
MRGNALFAAPTESHKGFECLTLCVWRAHDSRGANMQPEKSSKDLQHCAGQQDSAYPDREMLMLAAPLKQKSPPQ